MIMRASPKFSRFFFFFFLFLILSYVDHSQAQSDSCNAPLKLQPPLPFDSTSLHCFTVWPAQSFILRYVQQSANVWNFVLSAPKKNGYIAIGFSPDGNMVGSRAIVGWVEEDDTTLNMKKYFLGGYTPNLVTIESSSNQGLQVANSSIQLKSNLIFMSFQLTVNTATPNTRIIYAVGGQGFIPSGSNFRLSEHQDRISTVLNYATGQFESEKSGTASSLRRSHGLLNMFGWAIFIPIGAMVTRYTRHWENQTIRFYGHIIIQLIGFLLGFTGIICGLVLENRITASVSNHKGLGIFVLILGCLQVIALLGRPEKGSKIRKYWNWYHFGMGRLLIFLAAVNVFVGIHLANAGAGWNAGFALVIVLLFITSLILEIKLWSRI